MSFLVYFKYMDWNEYINLINSRIELNEPETNVDFVYDILEKKSGKLYLSENFEKVFSPFLLCRYFSMRKDLFDYSVYLNYINSQGSLSKKQFYIFAYNFIPKRTNLFIHYIKKIKKENSYSDDTEMKKEKMCKINMFDL